MAGPSTAGRKAQFCAETVLAFQALIAARDQIKQLAEEWNTDAVISGIVQADIDAAASPPPVVNGLPVPIAHLSPTILANAMTVVQPAIETNFHLANVIATLPT